LKLPKKLLSAFPEEVKNLQKASKVVVQDYGTNCKDCERYQKLGDICMIEHGKKFQWEYCRDFESRVVLPDYKELMRSVRADHALERKREKDRREKEKRKKQKEREQKEELRKKKRRSMLRKRRERLKEKLLKQNHKAKKSTGILPEAKSTTAKPARRLKAKRTEIKLSNNLNLEDAKNGVVSKRHGVSGKSPDVPDDKR
jgi:hypothetical protein